jgi:hypothetical protein
VSRRVRYPLLILAAALAASPAAPAAGASNSARVVVDDAATGAALPGRFEYVGTWQRVRGKHDGRSDGTSTRSTHLGDVAILRFKGTQVWVYGVLGPSGGRAGIALDDETVHGGRPVDFYAPHVRTNVLVYESPVLAAGVHTLTIVVWGTRDARGRFYYVNIDGAEYET